MAHTINKTDLVQIGGSAGHTVVDISGPLTRLNYFDGKFLRAPDLQAEQAAFLAQVRLSSQAGGAGLVHGFDCTLIPGDALRVSDGLGFDWQGRPLLMTRNIDVGIADLIDASRNVSLLRARAAAHGGLRADFADCPVQVEPLGDDNIVSAATFYLIVLNHIEAHCGEDDVYGKLCSEACISDTARSHIVEGVEISAVPITLLLKQSAQPFDNRHLRSRAASALFEKERKAIASLISAQGLASSIWCRGAEALTGAGVPIALLGRSATSTLFLDAWAARRERIDLPPYQYWAARLAMRSTRIYLAQIAQFQCQLRDCLRNATDPSEPTPDDPCADEKRLLQATALDLDVLVSFYARAAEQMPGFVDDFSVAQPRLDVSRLERQIDTLRNAGIRPVSDQILIDCGIVELPSAGYLPVAPASNLPVNVQVRKLLGAGVDLRFCVVRPDFVPHALEEAQHMERICLVTGLDDPAQKPQLDILVPDGRIDVVGQDIAVAGLRARVQISSLALAIGRSSDRISNSLSTNVGRISRIDTNRADLPEVEGAARSATEANGPVFYLAAETASARGGRAAESVLGNTPDNILRLLGDETSSSNESRFQPQRAVTNLGLGLSLWVEMSAARDPFTAVAGDSIDVRARFILVGQRGGAEQATVQRTINGRLAIEKNITISGGTEVTGRLQAQGLWQNREIGGDGQVDASSDTVTFNDDVVLRRARVPGLPPAMTLTLLNPALFGGLDNVSLVFEQTWASTDKLQFRAFVHVQRGGSNTGLTNISNLNQTQEIDLVTGTTIADATALTPGSAPHSASLEAINTIDAVLKGAGFAEHAATALFPKPAPVPDELTIIAEHPWVLFHRRRTKVCEHERVVDAVRPARNYRVYHAPLDPDTATDDFVAALNADFAAAIGGLRIRPAGTVEFAPGQQSIATPHSDVRANWEAAVQSDADVHVGVIASQGDAIDDGVSLATARLRSLTDVLSSVSQSADDLELLTTSNVPTTLSAGALDGVIVYFTRAVSTVCHSVLRLVSNNPDNVFEQLEAYFANPGTESLLNFIQRLEGQVLSARPRFVGGTDHYFTPAEATQLTAAWNLLGDGPVTHAISVSSENDADGQQVAIGQSSQLAQTVGGTVAPEDIQHRVLAPGLFKDCPRATIMLAATQCNEVVAVAAFVRDLDRAVQDAITLIEGEGLPPEFFVAPNDSNTITPLGSVRFFAGTPGFEPESQQQFLTHWQSQLGSVSPSSIEVATIGVARAGADAAETAANRDLARAQAAKLSDAMGISVQALAAAVHNPAAAFPVDCDFFTLILVPRESNFGIVTVNARAAGDAGDSIGLADADSIMFDTGGEIVRDARLRRTIEGLRASGEPVSRIEIRSLRGRSDASTRKQAEAMLAVLRESGLASDDARVVDRKATASERVEILRSGLLLNNGLVLRR